MTEDEEIRAITTWVVKAQARQTARWMNAAQPGLLFDNPNLESTMQSQSPPVYVFKSHSEAEEAVHALSKSGFDVTKLSIIGKGHHTEEKLMGFYT